VHAWIASEWNKELSCCWDSRSYSLLVQNISALRRTVYTVYRPLFGIAIVSMLSMAILCVEMFWVRSLSRQGRCRGRRLYHRVCSCVLPIPIVQTSEILFCNAVQSCGFAQFTLITTAKFYQFNTNSLDGQICYLCKFSYIGLLFFYSLCCSTGEVLLEYTLVNYLTKWLPIVPGPEIPLPSTCLQCFVRLWL